jgi:hypothetical protein
MSIQTILSHCRTILETLGDINEDDSLTPASRLKLVAVIHAMGKLRQSVVPVTGRMLPGKDE